MITLDTEGVGLNGPPVSYQWARDEEKPRVHWIWDDPVRKTLRLIDAFCEEDFLNFWNATFDWFQTQRLQNILRLLPLDRPPTLAGWLRVEKKAIDGPCVKPRSAFDGFLYARKGPWQSLMARDDIRIRKVPVQLAQMLADFLTETTDLDPIYFSRRQKGMIWEVDEAEDEDFPDVVLRFGASAGLKPLSRHCLGVEVVEMDEFAGDLYANMTKNTWDPFVTDWRPKFDTVRGFWKENKTARKYMTDDVILTRRMRHYLGDPPHGDDDSVLACQVGSARWRGFATNRPALQNLLDKSEAEMGLAPRDWRAVLAGIRERLAPGDPNHITITNTRTETLAQIAGEQNKEGRWVGGWRDHPAVPFVRNVIVARSAEKIRDYCVKLLRNRRGHPDFRIIATLSNRMGGTGGLNWQAFPDVIKKCLSLAWGNQVLDGGDFWAFEVTLMAAIWKDEQLIRDLESGHKIHALFGSAISGMCYEDIYDDETETAIDKDAYDKFKRGFFGKSMGAQAPKLASVIFPEMEKEEGIAKVEDGLAEFERRYPGIGLARKRIEDSFCSMRQPGGIGTQVVWHEPAEYVDSIFGFRRYYKLENTLCKALFQLANQMPPEFRKIKNVKVSRRTGRLQTPGGATQSAIFAAAFNIQARAMRSAANHEIQASGAKWNKEVQRGLWDLQPHGVHDWMVQLLNEHDSVMAVKKRDIELADIVEGRVEAHRDLVPLGRMDWKSGLKAWK